MKSVVLPLTNGTEREFPLKKLTVAFSTEINKIRSNMQGRIKAEGSAIDDQAVTTLPADVVSSLIPSRLADGSLGFDDEQRVKLRDLQTRAVEIAHYKIHAEIFRAAVDTSSLAAGEAIDWDGVEVEVIDSVGSFFRQRARI